MALGDRPAVTTLFGGLSAESRLLRFHSAGSALDEQARDVITSGHVLDAELQGNIVALASYGQRASQGVGDPEAHDDRCD